MLLKMNKPAESLEISEHIKARSFADTFSRRPEALSHDLPQYLLIRDRSLNEELAAALKELQNARIQGDRTAAEKLAPRASETRSILEAHIDDLRARYPLFAATKYPQSMNPERMALKESEWIVSYRRN